MEHLTALSPIIAIVAAIIAILAIIIAFVKCGRLWDEIGELHERIEKRKIEANLMEQKFRHEIDNLKAQLKSVTPQSASSTSTSVAKKEETCAEPIAEETKPRQVEEKPKDVEHTLYASSYDSERNQFFAIENSPSQKTIYEITYFESNPEVGYFTIFNEAENKVVECRDHLEAASEIEGRGKKIDWDTLNPGKLQKKDNNWEVVVPLTVKFV